MCVFFSLKCTWKLWCDKVFITPSQCHQLRHLGESFVITGSLSKTYFFLSFKLKIQDIKTCLIAFVRMNFRASQTKCTIYPTKELEARCNKFSINVFPVLWAFTMKLENCWFRYHFIALTTKLQHSNREISNLYASILKQL